MRVNFVTTYDSADVRQWSGIPKYMAAALERRGIDLVRVRVRDRITDRALAKLIGRTAAERRLGIAKRYARQIPDAGDAVLSPGTIPASASHGPLPIVIWTDVTFAAIIDFYAGYTGLSRRELRVGHAQEQRAIDGAAALVYSNEWAAESAVRDYGASPEKVHVVPFGANLDVVPTRQEAEAMLRRRRFDRVELLLVGVDWERKGGAIAAEATRELNRRGIATRLTVVGCDVPAGVAGEINRLGFIDKNRDAGRLSDLYASSHFLILPSRAECSASVLNEAAAFAVPSLTTDVGGNSTAVETEVTGKLLPADAGGAAYADFVQGAFSRYDELALAALRDYHGRRNWDTAAATVVAIVRSVVR
jgi:glycosyltransferase involved in cell wall biosynthesis